MTNNVTVVRLEILLLLSCSLADVANTTDENYRWQEITRAAAPGETVLLPCRLPYTTVDWLYHDHRDRHNYNITHNGFVDSKFYGRFQLDSDGLLINDVHIEDQGTYTCVDHHHQHRQIRLFVPCEKMYVREGQSITLKCQAVLHDRIIWSFILPHDSNDIRIVYWQKRIYNADRQRFEIQRLEKGVFDLLVTRVTASDAGIYRCRESDGRYPGESCTEVIVVGDCPTGYTKCKGSNATRLCIYDDRMCDGDDNCGNNWDEEPAQCHRAVYIKRIFVGETAHLHCGDAKTLESPVDWLYGKSLFVKKHLIVSGGKLINGGVGGRFNITGSTLIINNVTKDDNGVYTCVEDTRVGKQHRVVLDVQVKQLISRKEVTAVIGGRVTIPCWTKLTTPVDWYYLSSPNALGEMLCSAGNILNGYRRRFALDRSVPGDFGLIIVNVTREDAGLYICKEDAGLSTEHQVTLSVGLYEQERANTVRTSKGLPVWSAFAIAPMIILPLGGFIVCVALITCYCNHCHKDYYQSYRYERGQQINLHYVRELDRVFYA